MEAERTRCGHAQICVYSLEINLGEHAGDVSCWVIVLGQVATSMSPAAKVQELA